jgi:hypothetical protein
VTRLRIFVLFAATLALVTAFAACGGGDDGGSPQSVLEDATLQGIESGKIDLSLDIDAKGREGGTVDVSLSGAFQGEGEAELPRLDLTASAKGSLDREPLDFEGGLVLLPNQAYIEFEGVDYEVDPVTFSLFESVLEEGRENEGADGESESVTACQEAFGELKLSDFGDDLANDGSADVGGTSTTKVSGDLDVGGAVDSLVEIAQTPACEAQLGEGPLPSDAEINKAKGEVEDGVKKAHVDVYVGEDDIVRRISAQLAIEPKGSGSGPESADLDFDLTLTEVNEEQSIVAPAKSKPLNDLFLKLGLNPIALLSLLEGGGGLGGLLDELSSGGDSRGAQAYGECLQKARNAADIQKCGSLLVE